jgi:transposase
MAARPMNHPPAAQHSGAVRCFMAIELSKTSWVVAVCAPDADKVSVHKLAGGDTAGLLALIGRVRRRVERNLGRPVEVMSCYEAGYDGFWLHRRLEAQGVRNVVFDPASLLVNRRARRAKTDRIDAQALVRALMAHLRGEPKVVSVVGVPTPAEEDARRLPRERRRLVAERTQHVNRVKGLLATQGIRDYEPIRGTRWSRLEELRTGDGRALMPRLKAEIARELRRLELVMAMIAEVEAARDAVIATPATDHPHGEKIRQLVKLRSIGPELATVVVGEALHRTFANRRQVGGYVGLAPSPFRSGDRVRDQGIAKAGNPTARTAMIELAWLWLRHQPDSALSRWFRARVGALKGRPRRIAIVALARKLIVALWRYLETGLVPTGAVLKG